MAGMRRCSVAEASAGRSSLERTGPGAWHQDVAAKDTAPFDGHASMLGGGGFGEPL